MKKKIGRTRQKNCVCLFDCKDCKKWERDQHHLNAYTAKQQPFDQRGSLHQWNGPKEINALRKQI